MDFSESSKLLALVSDNLDQILEANSIRSRQLVTNLSANLLNTNVFMFDMFQPKPMSVMEENLQGEYDMQLGYMYLIRGRRSQIEGDLDQSLRDFESAYSHLSHYLGDADFNTQDINYRIGMIYRDKGEPGKAVEYFEKAFNSMLETNSAGHWTTMLVLDRLAGVLRDNGEYKKVESLVLPIYEKHHQELGVEHKHTQTAIYLLARNYDDWGRLKERDKYREMYISDPQEN